MARLLNKRRRSRVCTASSCVDYDEFTAGGNVSRGVSHVHAALRRFLSADQQRTVLQMNASEAVARVKATNRSLLVDSQHEHHA